jgi:hypothetical protein
MGSVAIRLSLSVRKLRPYPIEVPGGTALSSKILVRKDITGFQSRGGTAGLVESRHIPYITAPIRTRFDRRWG